MHPRALALSLALSLSLHVYLPRIRVVSASLSSACSHALWLDWTSHHAQTSLKSVTVSCYLLQMRKSSLPIGRLNSGGGGSALMQSDDGHSAHATATRLNGDVVGVVAVQQEVRALVPSLTVNFERFHLHNSNSNDIRGWKDQTLTSRPGVHTSDRLILNPPPSAHANDATNVHDARRD